MNRKTNIYLLIGTFAASMLAHAMTREEQLLVAELNESRSDTNLIEGVNQLANHAFIETQRFLNEQYVQQTHNNNPRVMYYPASGADICFPFLLFPSLKTVYATALEEFGEISDINKDRFENGSLPTSWHITGTPGAELTYSGTKRGFAHYYEGIPEGWDEVGYYQSRDNKICADLLFRIKHILHGTILNVTEINKNHHEIEFLFNSRHCKFIYVQSDKGKTENTKNYFMTILPNHIDILFLKGAHDLVKNQEFLSLCTDPFLQPERENYLSLIVDSPQSTTNSSVDHVHQLKYIFKTLDDAVFFKTEFNEQDRFAFGYLDMIYVGPNNALRTTVFVE